MRKFCDDRLSWGCRIPTVRLETSESGDTLELVMSAEDWSDFQALAEFARVTIAYDAGTPYVAQVFLYPTSRPEDILGNANTQAAFAAAAQLELAPDAHEAVLRLPMEQMRQLLVMTGKAAEAEDQADLIHQGIPAQFPFEYPDLRLPPSHYAAEFERLLRNLSR